MQKTTENDEDFKFDFARFSTKNSSLARYLLEQLEIKYRLEAGNGNPIPDNVSLEHIVPQTIDYEDWFGKDNIPDRATQDSFEEEVIYRIGNMALLKQTDNSTASNKSYTVKREIYINGGSKVKDYGKPAETYELIKNLTAQYQTSFAQAEVNQRSKEFAEKAVEIWPVKVS